MLLTWIDPSPFIKEFPPPFILESKARKRAVASVQVASELDL